MNTKELLAACRNAAKNISDIERKIERLGSIGGPGEVKAHVLTGMPRGTNRPDAAQNQMIEGLEQALREKWVTSVGLMMEFEGLLNEVADITDKAILRYYYCSGWTDVRIGKEVKLTDKRVRDRRKEAAMESECE